MNALPLRASGSLCSFHENRIRGKITWCRLLYGRDVMWVKTGSELWEIMHMLTSNKISCNRKCSISLAKYAEPFFDVEHIYVIEANSLFLPSHSKCFSEDEFSFQEIYDEVIETIVNRCEDFNIPSPNLVEKDDKGYFLQWDDTFTQMQIKEWSTIQRRLRRIFAEWGAVVCTTPNAMLLYEEPDHYSVCEIIHDRRSKKNCLPSLREIICNKKNLGRQLKKKVKR